MAHWITKFSCSLVWVTSRAQKKLSTHRCNKFLHRCENFSASWLRGLNWLLVGRVCKGSFSDHFLTQLLLGYPLGAKIKQTEGAKGSNFKKENFFKKFFRKFFCFLIFDPNFGPQYTTFGGKKILTSQIFCATNFYLAVLVSPLATAPKPLNKSSSYGKLMKPNYFSH